MILSTSGYEAAKPSLTLSLLTILIITAVSIIRVAGEALGGYDDD